jgi:hypothetical protein
MSLAWPSEHRGLLLLPLLTRVLCGVQVSGSNIEVGIIGADKTFKVLSEAEVQDYLQEVE